MMHESSFGQNDANTYQSHVAMKKAFMAKATWRHLAPGEI